MGCEKNYVKCFDMSDIICFFAHANYYKMFLKLNIRFVPKEISCLPASLIISVTYLFVAAFSGGLNIL